VTRQDYITHILTMMNLDIEYARWALKNYNTMLPDMQLSAGVRDALKDGK
jgi:hypothetical protein